MGKQTKAAGTGSSTKKKATKAHDSETVIRKEKPHPWGTEGMLFRVKEGDKWRECDGRTPDRKADSRVHRFARRVGFEREDHQEEKDDARIKEVRERQRVMADDLMKSAAQIVERFALFERFLLCVHKNNPYTSWLLSLEKRTTPVLFQAPPLALLESYLVALRDGVEGKSEVGYKGGTIRVYIGGIGATCRDFGVKSPTDDRNLQKWIKKYEEDDGNDASPGFDFVTYLPPLYTACFSMPAWGIERMIMCWVMFLLAICLMARSSDLTEFCPLIEDTLLPEKELWDTDGYPPWIDIGLRDWKHRSRKNKGKRYSILLHRNYLDPRFCPVVWLLLWLDYSGLKSGPIFQKKDKKGFTGEALKENVWAQMTRRLFVAVGLYVETHTKDGKEVPGTGVTAHGIRRATAAWAGRCGASLLGVKSNGRWKTYEEMSVYLNEGKSKHEEATRRGGEDPIFKMWVWKPVTVGSCDGKSQM